MFIKRYSPRIARKALRYGGLNCLSWNEIIHQKETKNLSLAYFNYKKGRREWQ
ncbi:MAG: hypothetical protein NQ127_03770 [Candidatus Cardinium sp.]|nr:hypothetical protein [Candidatus Cardinium sp.]